MAKRNACEKYGYLDRLSTDQLEELLRADFESDEHSDVDVIFHILEVIEKRERTHPTGRLPEKSRAARCEREKIHSPRAAPSVRSTEHQKMR